MSSGPTSGDMALVMFASSAPAVPDGMLSGQKLTLWGGVETTVHLMPSPCLIVRSLGSNRYPVASPIIFTSQVLPVIGLPAAAPPGAAAVVAPAAGAGVGAAAVVAPVLAPAPVFSPPPPQAV